MEDDGWPATIDVDNTDVYLETEGDLGGDEG